MFKGMWIVDSGALPGDGSKKKTARKYMKLRTSDTSEICRAAVLVRQAPRLPVRERKRERSIIVLEALSAYCALLLMYICFPKITEKT